MPSPPNPKDYAGPIEGGVEPAEEWVINRQGDVTKWTDLALKGPPSPGALGRMELLQHWERMSEDQRRQMILHARAMLAPERR